MHQQSFLKITIQVRRTPELVLDKNRNPKSVPDVSAKNVNKNIFFQRMQYNFLSRGVNYGLGGKGQTNNILFSAKLYYPCSENQDSDVFVFCIWFSHDVAQIGKCIRISGELAKIECGSILEEY